MSIFFKNRHLKNPCTRDIKKKVRIAISPIQPIFILWTVIDDSFGKALFNCKIRATTLNAPINGGLRKVVTTIEKQSKSEVPLDFFKLKPIPKKKFIKNLLHIWQ